MMNRTDFVLSYIASYINEHRYSPTVREITAAVGLNSTSAAQYHLRKLSDEGRIICGPKYCPRMIALPEEMKAESGADA